ncbi:MAG: hypothetical protein KGL46_06435 [Hyphomicrobiales bacterium]|nr:hypothetical protein [Hyphomicrobiales bacterium]
MLRFLNVIATFALIGSAVYAYTIKYQTMYRAEQIAKMKSEIKSEQDAMAILRAEWAHQVRPDRIQPLAEKFLTMQQTKPIDITTIAALPERGPKADLIGRELQSLGLEEPTNTPAVRANTQTTPASKAPR